MRVNGGRGEVINIYIFAYFISKKWRTFAMQDNRYIDKPDNGISVGGKAFNNGVEFFSENYSAKCIMDSHNSNYEISTDKRPSSKGAKHIIGNIPILRGLYSAFYRDKISALSLVFLIIIDFFSDKRLRKMNKHASPLIKLLYRVFVISSFIYVFKTRIYKIKSTWAFHGAEHKTAYAYDNGMELTLENVRGCPRIAKRCGSNFTVFLVAFYALSGLFTRYRSIKQLVSYSLAYELFDLEDGDRLPIIKMLFKVGYLCQQKLFTIEPTDVQIKASIDTLNQLIALENKEIRSPI